MSIGAFARALLAPGSTSRPFFVRGFKVRKRFYDKVTITRATAPGIAPVGRTGADFYEINLDRRKVKTPLGSVLLVPGEALAVAVAEEWDAQAKEVKLNEMHLTALCNTAIDNPSKLSVGGLVSRISSYLETDTVLHREDTDSELGKLQEQLWGGVVDWFHKYLEVQPSDGRISVPRSPLGVPEIPDGVRARFDRYLAAGDIWALHGFLYGTETVKSAILTTAAIAGKLEVGEAVRLSRLEVEYQISRWGRVEWAHDLENEATKSRLAAAVIFTRLTSLSERTIFKGASEA